VETVTDKVDKVPVEPKVSLGTIAGGSGAILSALVLWLLGVTIFGVPFTADQADDAIAAVPWPISGTVTLLLSVGGYFFGGYMAPHAPRLGDSPQPIVVNNVSSLPAYKEAEQDEVVDFPDEEIDLSDEIDDVPVVDDEDDSFSKDGIQDDPEKV
jgi:hypothetical protein